MAESDLDEVRSTRAGIVTQVFSFGFFFLKKKLCFYIFTFIISLQLTKLNTRFIESETDGTDPRKAAELESKIGSMFTTPLTLSQSISFFFVFSNINFFENFPTLFCWLYTLQIV